MCAFVKLLWWYGIQSVVLADHQKAEDMLNEGEYTIDTVGLFAFLYLDVQSKKVTESIAWGLILIQHKNYWFDITQFLLSYTIFQVKSWLEDLTWFEAWDFELYWMWGLNGWPSDCSCLWARQNDQCSITNYNVGNCVEKVLISYSVFFLSESIIRVDHLR